MNDRLEKELKALMIDVLIQHEWVLGGSETPTVLARFKQLRDEIDRATRPHPSPEDLYPREIHQA